MKTTRIIPFYLSLIGLLWPGWLAAIEPTSFLSTQLNPLPEATLLRQVILKDFPQAVDFIPFNDRAETSARVIDLSAIPNGPVVLGLLQEDFLGLYKTGALENVDNLTPELADRAFFPRLAALGKLGTAHAYFVPWMQATYLMAANKRALKYLPKGADLKRLSYAELKRWAANMYRVTGRARLGFPAGPKGLMPRFLQGYLYPSFAGSTADEFASPAAQAMWQYLGDLWKYVAPSSLITNRMDQSLINGEVWVAWDHTARLLEAFRKQPGEFVAFAAPLGPRGRGIIAVLAGLGLPKGSSPDAGQQLIEYLTRPQVQLKTMESVGFLPVVETDNGMAVSKGLLLFLQAATDQLESPEAIVSSAPIWGADEKRSYDLVYLLAFSRIVLRNMSIQAVLQAQEKKLREIRQ